jgi:hypothetical protein
MKRILALLLVLLLLFCTFGCKEEPPENTEQPPKREWGEFTTEDGYVQNSLITAVLNTEELVAPVTELSYTLYDNTDFGIVSDYYTNTNDERTHRLEICENGEWKQAPTGGSLMTERGSLYVPDADPAAHRSFHYAMEMKLVGIEAMIQYRPLQPGSYRLIVSYILNTDDPDIEIPKGNHAALLYFTVTGESTAPDLSDRYYADGLCQSADVTTALVSTGDDQLHFDFCVQNNGLKRLVIPANTKISQYVRLQYWDEGVSSEGLRTWRQYFPEEDTYIHPGDVFRLPLLSQKDGGPPERYEFSDGLHRFSFRCYWEDNPYDVFYAVFYFRVQDGVITEGTPPVPDAP